MTSNTPPKEYAKDYIKFLQGFDDLLDEKDSPEEGLKKISTKIADLTNIKNLYFLLGAGASSDSIPAMADLLKRAKKEVHAITEQEAGSLETKEGAIKLYDKIEKNNSNNLENILGSLYSRKTHLDSVKETQEKTNLLIEKIENTIFKSINIDTSSANAKKSLSLYTQFYQKLSLRNKDVSRVSVFTTNNDLLSETALGYLNINYINGFSGGLSRTFNPARFTYTQSRKIDNSLEKYEPIENIVYLYKLHGSINWIEDEGNSLFKIREIDIDHKTSPEEKNILIYPTPLKQNKSLGTPYSDLIREFQSKLLLKHSVLFVVGYSFSDEHINNAIYSALASNSSLSIFIFGDYPTESLFLIPDRRIYKTSGQLKDKSKIHYFDYIIKNFIPDLDKNKETEIIEQFIKALPLTR